MAAKSWLRALVAAHPCVLAWCWTAFHCSGQVRVSRNSACIAESRTSSFRRKGLGGRPCTATAVTMSGQEADDVGRRRSTTDRPRLLGLGSAGVDFIASVERYPAADAKIRTESLEIMGGGNCGNTLSAASRLGLDACLLTKVGSDANGRLILGGLEEEGVDVSRVVVSDATPSAFTYVIVDQEGGTRTCLHTPQTEDILPQEIAPEHLDGVAVVHLDSRHTPAAIALATLANQRGVPVVLDAEKDRPHLKELLPLADFIICNRNFPQAFTGSTSREAAIRELLGQGRARLVATTLGADGCMFVTKGGEEPWEGYEDFSLPADCPMTIKTAVTPETSSSPDIADAVPDENGASARYVWAPCWPVEASDVVDTTGAGDCFIAGFIYGLTHRLGIARTVALASLVAARKLSQPGARRGVPTLAKLDQECPGLLAR